MTPRQAGKFVQELRESAGLTRMKLAEKAGISRTTIWRMEEQGHCTLSNYLDVLRVFRSAGPFTWRAQ